MSWLKRKETTREDYEAATRRVDKAERDMRNSDMSRRFGSTSDFGYAAYRKDYEKAQRALARIEKRSHSEALKLNRQYDLLTRKAKEAQKTLEEFEREKLGMHTRPKKHIGQVVGIIAISLLILSSLTTNNITSNAIGTGEVNFAGFSLLIMGFFFGVGWLILKIKSL